VEIDVKLFLKKSNVFFSFTNGKINIFDKNIIKYKKDIAKHVFYCFPRLNFKYKICNVSRLYEWKFY